MRTQPRQPRPFVINVIAILVILFLTLFLPAKVGASTEQRLWKYESLLGELTLFDSPCVHGGVMAILKPDYRSKFKKAYLRGKQGRDDFYACWIETPEGEVYVQFEDWDWDVFQWNQFKESRATSL
jgi:hypothetical protein